MWIRIFKRMSWQATTVALTAIVMLLALAEERAFGQPVPKPSDSAAAQALLLDGVRAFRGERFDEALAIFQRVEAAGQSGDIGFYLGMTLHKLGRHLEALVALRTARRHGLREPVADYYQAVSCYRLGMFERARQIFATLSAQAAGAAGAPVLGPRLQQGAQRFAQAIDQARNAQPGDKRAGRLQQVELARVQADEQLIAGAKLAALEWLDEATSLLAQVPERAEKLPAMRGSLLRLREALVGQPAAAEIETLWSRVSGGAI